MRAPAVVVFAALLTGCLSSEDPCLSKADTRDFDVYSEGDLQAMSSYSCLDGHLFLHSSSVTDLDALAGLEQIHGGLSLHGNQQLVDAGGMINLTGVDEGIAFQSHELLPSLDGFDSLTSIGGSVSITGNLSLQSVNGFHAVDALSGSLHISDNPQLTSLQGFGSLTHVAGGVAITNNPALPTCQAERLRAQLDASTPFDIYGTDDTATCN
jgi:hypothetical protein